MIDLHSHVLYDIEGDDGSRSEAMSLELLRLAEASGTEELFVTPHCHRRGVVPLWQSITERTRQLQQKARAEGLSITLHTGAEVSLDADTLNYLPGGGNRDYCLAGTAYILVELLPTAAPEETWNLLYQLQLRGYLPILAHPERYRNLMEHPETVRQWVEKGIFLQSNLGSFTGEFGDRAQNNVSWLQQHGLIHFLGSDAHRTSWRTTDTTEARRAISALPGGRQLLETSDAHARLLLQNKVFYPEVPAEPRKKKKSWWRRLF